MAAEIMDGKALAGLVRQRLKYEVSEFKKLRGVVPCLATVLVGEDPASKIYIGRKKKACEEVGMVYVGCALPKDAPEAEVLRLLNGLNSDKKIHGIIVQLPLPGHLDEHAILSAISREKDVDGLHPDSLGRLLSGSAVFEPCTPKGIVRLLESLDLELAGKHVTILGRSSEVGKPLALMLMGRDATVTVCHSRTHDLCSHTRNADILISSVGKPNFVSADMVGGGTVVIDVGMNRAEGGRLVGDVNFEEVRNKASHITPVPGGVGPMTVAMLLENTLIAAKMQSRLRIGVLASTRGSDLQAIIEQSRAGTLPCEVAVVVSDKKDAYALERARAYGIDAVFVEQAGTREESDGRISEVLDGKNVELVVLIGYMKLLSPWFVNKYRNKIINIHPSLLPKYPGIDRSVHKAVLDAGEKVTGCTVHFVDEGKDTGKIILQKEVPILEGDTVEVLRERVQAAERETLPEAIRMFAEGRI